MSIGLYVVAVIVFVLVGLGVDFDAVDRIELLAFGLASFTLAHVVPR